MTGLAAEGVGQRAGGRVDPGEVRVPVPLWVLDQQVVGLEDLADPFGEEAGVGPGQVVDVPFLNGRLPAGPEGLPMKHRSRWPFVHSRDRQQAVDIASAISSGFANSS
ncbi:hypothetical protein MTF65_02955 [Streptomyces sp. APSN-46.1]|uniref:hypothetical protein n=1 Tax=Streptomyces sp. APSN-46.1 TaxID=2929049 RepID=UPI001FB36B82|nr:hypothetical protein [Streptomyces sp. APSN-46.1]MCJ1676330.1 hypothetical protein [Streptomyces sp. APSN-46.1]